MKAIYGVILVVLLGSCSPFGLNPMGYKVLYEDLDTAWKKVSSMKYINDPEKYWKSPQEFFSDGGGDCEDFATALMYLLGPDASIVIVGNNYPEHTIVYYKGFYIESQIYELYVQYSDINILYTLSYDSALFLATAYGVKSIRS
jgi:hypothetical protein